MVRRRACRHQTDDAVSVSPRAFQNPVRRAVEVQAIDLRRLNLVAGRLRRRSCGIGLRGRRAFR